MLSAELTPTDRARAGRLVLAWLLGDKAMLDLTLDEAGSEATGVPGVLFALLDLTVAGATAAYGEDGAVDQLRRSLLVLAERDEDDEQDDEG